MTEQIKQNASMCMLGIVWVSVRVGGKCCARLALYKSKKGYVLFSGRPLAYSLWPLVLFFDSYPRLVIYVESHHRKSKI
jgi:hypothetical protein